MLSKLLVKCKLMKLLKFCTITLMVYILNSTNFHMGYISVQNTKSDINCLVSYTIVCPDSDRGFGESSLHVLSLLPHVASSFL